MMEQTLKEILTALFKGIYIGLALFGAGMANIPLTLEDLIEL